MIYIVTYGYIQWDIVGELMQIAEYGDYILATDMTGDS